MVAAAIAVVFLCACFMLLIWVGLVNRTVFSPSAEEGSIARSWPGFVLATSPELFMTYNIVHTTLLGSVGYLVWSGTEPFTPPSLNTTYQGRFYTAMMAFYFIYVALEMMLMNQFVKLASGERVAATVLNGFAWIIVLVLAFVCGDAWSFQWPAQRAIGLALWLSLPIVTLNFSTIYLLCGFNLGRFESVVVETAASASISASSFRQMAGKHPHLKF
jgi:hypothetical protein